MFKRNHILALILLVSLAGLSACAYRPPVQQGTILTDAAVQGVHRGMTRSQIQTQLGKPVLMNIYRSGRLTYVYTLQPSRHTMKERQLFIYFRSGKVSSYKVDSSPNLKPPV